MISTAMEVLKADGGIAHDDEVINTIKIGILKGEFTSNDFIINLYHIRFATNNNLIFNRVKVFNISV